MMTNGADPSLQDREDIWEWWGLWGIPDTHKNRKYSCRLMPAECGHC